VEFMGEEIVGVVDERPACGAADEEAGCEAFIIVGMEKVGPLPVYYLECSQGEKEVEERLLERRTGSVLSIGGDTGDPVHSEPLPPGALAVVIGDQVDPVALPVKGLGYPLDQHLGALRGREGAGGDHRHGIRAFRSLDWQRSVML